MPDPAGVVAGANAHIDRVLARVIPRGAPVALLGVTALRNPGDCAILAGTRRALTRAGARLVYVGDAGDRPSPRRLGDAVVLLAGGGNFGDLHAGGAQQAREWALATLRDRRVVQLPQSIRYERQAARERMRRLVGDHPDCTILVRDRRSEELARTALDAAVELCPDLAFALGPRSRPRPPDAAVVWLARRDDPEALPAPPVEVPAGVVAGDWPPPGARTRTAQRLRAASRRLPGLRPLTAGAWRRLVAAAAEARVGEAEAHLARGRAVVTDRLHGHVLSTLLGLPHVLVDNRIGKLSAYHETWNGPGELAAAPGEALARARELAGA